MLGGHRRQRSIGAAFEPARGAQNPMFDAFCVVGLKKKTTQLNTEHSQHIEESPSVLARYPRVSGASPLLPFSLVALCTPHLSHGASIRINSTKGESVEPKADDASAPREPPPLPAKRASKIDKSASFSLSVSEPPVAYSGPRKQTTQHGDSSSNHYKSASSSPTNFMRSASASLDISPVNSKLAVAQSALLDSTIGSRNVGGNVANQTLRASTDEPRRHATSASTSKRDGTESTRKAESRSDSTVRVGASGRPTSSAASARRSGSSRKSQSLRHGTVPSVPELSVSGATPPRRARADSQQQTSMFARFVDSLTPRKAEKSSADSRDFKHSASESLPVAVDGASQPSRMTPLVRRIRRTSSRTQINEVVFGALANSERSSSSFIFLATCDDTVYYGSCVVVEELLDSLPSFVTFPHGAAIPSKADPREQQQLDVPTSSISTEGTSLSPPPLPARSSSDGEETVMHSTQRVYVLVSKFPFFRLHFNVLHSVLARERQLRFESQANAGDELGSPGFATTEDELLASQTIYNMLSYYQSVPVPVSGDIISIQLPDEPRHLDFSLSSGSGNDDMLIGAWCLPSLLSALPWTHVMTLVSCALLELPIVIVCSNIGTLANIVLSLVPLIKPFIWQGPLVSVLPRGLFSLLQAPVPFLCGVLELPRPGDDDECDLSHVVICDVERQRLLLPRKGTRVSLSLRAFPSIEESHLGIEPFDTLESISHSRRLDTATEAPALPGLVRTMALAPIHQRFYKRKRAAAPFVPLPGPFTPGHRRSRSGGDAIRAMESAAAADSRASPQTFTPEKIDYHEPLHSTDDDLEAVRELVRSIRAHTHNLLANIIGQFENIMGDAHAVRDEGARAAVVARQPEVQRPWIEKLMLTQHFSCFLEELRESADESLLAQLHAASAVEDKIVSLQQERAQMATQIADLQERHSLLGQQISSLERSRDLGSFNDFSENRRRKSNVIKASLEALSMTYQRGVNDGTAPENQVIASGTN